jgi:hypothetical protein
MMTLGTVRGPVRVPTATAGVANRGEGGEGGWGRKEMRRMPLRLHLFWIVSWRVWQRGVGLVEVRHTQIHTRIQRQMEREKGRGREREGQHIKGKRRRISC